MPAELRHDSVYFSFSSRRRHTRFDWTGVQTCALPILHCVGATTLDEYRKYVEKDAALARRFQAVFVGEPTVEDTISILRGLKEKYELHHGVRIDRKSVV